jgi:purine-binding chemotaxis protein CheW
MNVNDTELQKEIIYTTHQILTFKLGNEIFGLNVAQVREILEYGKITKVPQTPNYICGVLNLRGGVVPVVDMRIKFGLEQSNITVNTCIIVVEVNIDNELSILGVVVDSVQEVFEIEAKQIEPPPKIGTRLKNEFIYGMGKHLEQFVILLNIDKIFSSDELILVNLSSN